MGIHAQQEWDEEVVGIPESLKGLLANPVVGSRVHHEHAEKHDVTSYTTRLGVMNLNSQLRPDLCSLDIEEAANVSTALELTVEAAYLT